jgi:hypothetical protein
MSIKCGKGHQHQSVAEVRECYGIPAEGFPNYRPNKYPGACRLCGGLVAPGEGRVEKIDNKWETSHHDGKCPAKPEKVPANTTGLARYAEIPQGHYATKSTGKNDLDFWRVDAPKEGQWAGRIFVKRVIGGKPDANVSRNAKFAALDAILAEGPEATAQRYGQELGRCSRCNRHLTDEISREFGMGPECRSK